MDVVAELEFIIKLAIHNAQPFASSSQILYFPFCLGSEWPASDRLKSCVFTEGIEGIVKYDLFVLGFGMIDDCLHVVEPDFSWYAAGYIKSIIQAHEQRILLFLKSQFQVFHARVS